MDRLVGHAPDGAPGCGEEEFFDGGSEDADSEEIADVVEAMNEFGEEEKCEEQQKNKAVTQGAGEDQRDQASAKAAKAMDGVVYGFVRMPGALVRMKIATTRAMPPAAAG